MAYDPSLSQPIDYLRFRLQDTDDNNPDIPEATYAAMIQQFGLREAGRQCCVTLAARYSKVNITDGDVREDLSKTADFYRALAAEIAADPMWGEGGAGVQAAAVGELINPDMSTWRG